MKIILTAIIALFSINLIPEAIINAQEAQVRPGSRFEGLKWWIDKADLVLLGEIIASKVLNEEGNKLYWEKTILATFRCDEVFEGNKANKDKVEFIYTDVGGETVDVRYRISCQGKMLVFLKYDTQQNRYTVLHSCCKAILPDFEEYLSSCREFTQNSIKGKSK